jgi:predicted nucleotidyltransferase
MGKLFQVAPQAKPVKPVTLSRTPKRRLPGDTVGAFQARCAQALRMALPTELKAHGAFMPAVDVDAMAESLAHQLAKLADVPPSKSRGHAQAQHANDWISTQEAANRCGFSRPFVAALLDSGAYTGKVHRTAGGHRKVLASEFEVLVAKASAGAPKTLAQAHKTVVLPSLDEPTRQAVRQFYESIKADFPVKAVMLYGSRARGDHRPDSDADVAVLLDGEHQPFLGTKLKMSDAAYDVLLSTGINISPLPVWVDEWEHPETYINPALLANIAREGVLVVV